MAVVTKIQLGKKGYLDLTEDVIAPLNFSIASIQNISQRTGVFSKTIKLPGTPNNKILLGQLFKVNVTDGSFDPNIKENVIVIKNGVTQFTGYLQLLNVIKTSPSFLGLDEEVEFEVAVKDDVGDFYSSIGDKFLETLGEFSGTTYNHTLSFDNVFATSAHTADDVYKYFMPHHLRDYYSLPDFNLSISAKAYWDAIWSEEGYSYDWAELSAVNFNRLWIPYNGDRPLRDINSVSFRASFSADSALIGLGKMPPVPNVTNWYWYQSASSTGYLYPISVVFNDDSTTGATGSLFDPSSSYNINTGIYSSSINGICEFKTRYACELYLYNPGPVAIRYEVAGTTDPAEYTIGLNAELSGLTLGGLFAAYSNTVYEKQFSYTTLSPTADTLIDSFIIDEQAGIVNLLTSTHVKNYLAVSKYTSDTLNGHWCDIISDAPVGSTMLPTLKVKFIGLPSGATNYNINYFRNTPSSSTEEGSPIILKNYIPKQIKRKEFIASIVKMFNLYISTTDDEKTLKIETRNGFYNNGGTKNWTSKLSKADDINLKFLPELQSKKLLFTYKADTDNYNSIYTETTGEVYGQLQYEFNSEFTKDTQTVDVIFSPTPSVKNKFNLVVPAITDRAPNNNIRILYDCGNITTPGLNTWIYSGQNNPTSYVFDTYPCLSTFDNPYTPSIDINWGYNDFLFYDDWFYLTDNNLFNQHYKGYVSQIESGKLFTAKFRLTELDILTLNLRDRIYIYDNYYYINRIIDYDCNSVDGLTQVELINVDEGIRFTARKTTTTVSGKPMDIIGGNGNSNMNRSAGNTTSTYGSGSYANTDNGEFNIFQPNTSFNTINGQNNNVAGTNNILQGDANNALGSNNNIVGSNNIIN